jgi:hypothetical protein
MTQGHKARRYGLLGHDVRSIDPLTIGTFGTIAEGVGGYVPQNVR